MSKPIVQIGERHVGEGEPVFIIAEIGINHNGSLTNAKKLIDGAVLAGCDAVKFQKRTPEKCVPDDQWYIERDTPWGRMPYIEYRHRVEFGLDQYEAIDRHCKERGILWFASCWDEESVEFIEQFNPPCYKIASACVTDAHLLIEHRLTSRSVIMSTGMSTLEEIEMGVQALDRRKLLIAHSTSTYPCPPEQLNLNMIKTLRNYYPDCPIGYSGHETGLSPTWAAVTLGAQFVERHITLDRAMWGSDQAASVEIGGLIRLVANIRDIEKSMGDGAKRVYPEEMKQRAKLRRVTTAANVEVC